MFFTTETCKRIGEALIGNNGYMIAIGLLASWFVAVRLGVYIVSNFIKYLQGNEEHIFKSSKNIYPAFKDKWIYWVTDIGLGKYNIWLGAFEITLFYICLLINKPEGIGAWLVFKVAAKWESWTNIVKFPEKIEGIDQFEYLKLRNNLATGVLQKFLIGTILNILVAFMGAAVFSWIRILAITEGLMRKFLFLEIVGIVIVIISVVIFEKRIVDKLPKRGKKFVGITIIGCLLIISNVIYLYPILHAAPFEFTKSLADLLGSSYIFFPAISFNLMPLWLLNIFSPGLIVDFSISVFFLLVGIWVLRFVDLARIIVLVMSGIIILEQLAQIFKVSCANRPISGWLIIILSIIVHSLYIHYLTRPKTKEQFK